MEYLLSPEEISPTEAIIRQRINFCIRLAIALFFNYQTFDFLFSPVWIHGYIWSLNQKIDLELSTKSAGDIFQHQLSVCGYSERIIYSTLLVFIIWIFLLISGFHNNNRTVWQLLQLSVMIGVLTANLRCLQMKQRLYSAIHEGFYAYFLTFITGLILTLQVNERINVSSMEVKLDKTPSITKFNLVSKTKKLL
ncbi:putative integral membrane protein [Acanthocheilonema viteae]